MMPVSTKNEKEQSKVASSTTGEDAFFGKLLADVCSCHTREQSINCALSAERVVNLGPFVTGENDLHRVWQALIQSRSNKTSLETELEFEIPLEEAENKALKKIKCPECKETSKGLLRRISTDATSYFTVDVADSKHEKNITWSLSAHPSKQAIVAKISPLNMKKKDEVHMSRSDDAIFEYLSFEASKEQRLIDCDDPLQVLDMLRRAVSTLEASIDYGGMLQTTDNLERVIEVIYSGFAYTGLFRNQPMPLELVRAFENMHFYERDFLCSVLTTMTENRWLDTQAFHRGICDICVQYMNLIHYSMQTMIFQEAFRIGLKITTESSPSYMISEIGRINSLTITTEYILSYSGSFFPTGHEAAMHRFFTQIGLITAETLNKRTRTISDILLSKPLLRHFLGRTIKREMRAEDIYYIIEDMHRQYIPVQWPVEELFALNRVDGKTLDEAIKFFWTYYATEALYNSYLHCYAMYGQLLHTNGSGVYTMLAAVEIMLSTKLSMRKYGGLDWLLGRLRGKNLSCLLLPDESISACASHVLGQYLLSESKDRLEKIRLRDEEEHRKRDQAAADAEKDLLEMLNEKAHISSGGKKRKKKPVTTTVNSVMAESESPEVSNGPAPAVRTSNNIIIDDQVKIKPEGPSIVDHHDDCIQKDINEWEEVSKKKVAKPIFAKESDAQDYQEVRIGRNIIEVSVISGAFGFVMGEKGKVIVQIEKQSGCQIEALPLVKGSSLRTFRCQGTEEQLLKACELIKERVEIMNGASVEGIYEKRFVILQSAVPRILGHEGKSVSRLERETNCKVTITETDPVNQELRCVILRGKEKAISSAYAKLQQFAKDCLEMYPFEVLPNPSIPPHKENQMASEFLCSKEVDDLELAIALSAKEEEERRSHEEARTVQTENISIESPGGHVQESAATRRRRIEIERLQTQEAEDAELARALAEEEEREFAKSKQGASSASLPGKAKVTAASIVARSASQTSKPPSARPEIQTRPTPLAASSTVHSFQTEEVEVKIVRSDWRNGSSTVDIPSAFLGRVMGQSGNNIRNIEKRTHTQIKQVRDDERFEGRSKLRRLQIYGTRDQADDAYRMIQDILGKEKTYAVPQSVYPKLFVDNARPINTIQNATATRISFQQLPSSVNDNKRVCVVSGSSDAIRRCRYVFELMALGHSVNDSLDILKTLQPKDLLSPPQPIQRRAKGMGGLSNSRGENSCFLNVVVQSLFHFSKFSDEMMNKLKSHRCKAQENPPGKCIVCSLLGTFRALNSSEEGTYVSSVELRQAVAESFEGAFDLGNMEDAVEAFERVLDAVHSCIVESEPAEGTVCTCVVHRCFASYTLQGVRCEGCVKEILTANSWVKKSSPALDFCQRTKHANENARAYSLIQTVPQTPHLIRYIFSAEIAEMARLPENLSFEEKVKRSMAVNPMSCPSCDQKALDVEFVLTKLPSAGFALGVGWTSETPDPEFEIRPLLEAISPKFDLAALSHNQTVDGSKSAKSYPSQLRGVICFNRRHYVAFFRKKTRLDWFEFDDATVKPIGASWAHAMTAILTRGFQPVVLFYEIIRKSGIDDLSKVAEIETR